MNSNTGLGSLIPVDRAGSPYIGANYADSASVDWPGPGIYEAQNVLRDEYIPNYVTDVADDEVGDYEIGEVGEVPGTGLMTQVGPFPAWVWLLGVGAVTAFWFFSDVREPRVRGRQRRR